MVFCQGLQANVSGTVCQLHQCNTLSASTMQLHYTCVVRYQTDICIAEKSVRMKHWCYSSNSHFVKFTWPCRGSVLSADHCCHQHCYSCCQRKGCLMTQYVTSAAEPLLKVCEGNGEGKEEERVSERACSATSPQLKQGQSPWLLIYQTEHLTY